MVHLKSQTGHSGSDRQRFHLTSRATRMDDTGKTWLDSGLPEITQAAITKGTGEGQEWRWEEASWQLQETCWQMTRPPTTASVWTIQKEKSSWTWEIFGRRTGSGDLVDAKNWGDEPSTTPKLLALQCLGKRNRWKWKKSDTFLAS